MLPSKGRSIASHLNRSLRTVTKNYSAAAPLTKPLEEDAATKAKRQIDDSVKVTTLNNGVKVVSCDAGGAVSRMTVATNAASRHETAGQLGISHVMKTMAFLTNNDRTALGIVRESQQVGGSLECATSREFQLRNSTFLRSKLAEVLENIASGITKPLFNHWEIKDAVGQARVENAAACSDQMAVNMELLHKAAYRNGLGNSVYCNNLRLGMFSEAELQQFASDNYVGNRLTIAATDVSHDELVRYAKEIFQDLPDGQAQQKQAQKYYGGEIHEYTDNSLTYASLVAEGASFGSADLPTFLVLQKMLGGSTHVKWGSNSQSSRLNSAAKGVTDGPLSINALNVSYSDSGLFGFNAISTPDAISSVLKSAVGQISGISKGEVSADELTRAKTQAKAMTLMLNESCEDCLDDMVQQATFTGSYMPANDAVGKIESVSKDQVVEAAKKMLTNRPTLVVNGNTSSAPYVDDLV